MGKLLRASVWVILVLSGVSLFFAHQLFQKRELLKARNLTFEDYVVKVASTIEAEDPADVSLPAVDKDVDDVTDRELANPELVSVFDGYPAKLETDNLPPFALGTDTMRLQLRSYYALDAEGKPILSNLDQRPMTTGPGTMTDLLEKVYTRAQNQQAVLNRTRKELVTMRENFASAVSEINKLKAGWRTTKRELTEARARIATLESEKADLESQVAKLTAEKRDLTAEVAEKQDQIQELEGKNDELMEQLTEKNELIEELKKRLVGTKRGDGTPGPDVRVSELSAGVKGSIVQADDLYKFVIINFSDDAMIEMLGEDRSGGLPQLEMNVRRPGRESATGEFVTRVRLRQIFRGQNLVVADILSDWQQVPVEKDDVVFF